MNRQIKAALFDLDGVVFHTEPQYTVYWRKECQRYFPEHEGMEMEIKGSTLQQILSKFFVGNLEAERVPLIERLNAFERDMDYPYVEGFEDFLRLLRGKGILTAIVTSSNQQKMEQVYQRHPAFKGMFDAILTAEDFAESKPHPDCYLRAAEKLSLTPHECVVFEDSFNGIRSGRAAGMMVVGLATTNDISAIQPLCDRVIPDYRCAEMKKIVDIFGGIE